MSGDEAAGEDKDVAMLHNNDTPEKNDTQEEEPKDSPPVAKPAAAEQQQPVIHAAGSKELRLQQQDDDEEEVAVQAVVADDDDEEDDDGDAVMASVVVDEEEDDDEEVPVAEVATTTDTTAAPAKKPSKATKSKPAKKGRKSQVISQDRLVAALEARRMLSDTVPRLPVAVRDTHVVRSFGRIRVETPTSEESKFSSANALYPVGFSCDRYEFSPVHGRVLKMRCTIFDASKLKEKQRQSWQTVSEDIPDGPVFRVMWGQGVDEDVDIVDYPYDLYFASAPISNDGKVDTAVSISAKDEAFEPEEGMRVRVRFDNNMWYSGTILSVAIDDAFYDHSKKKMVYDIRIHYDDGSIEDTHFPDPDVSIYLPGAEDASMENGIIEIDQLRGKPVTSVIGNSPLEAWGNALIKLGLIDEIMLQSALEARAVAQVEGRAEAEERFGIKKVNRQAPAQKHQKQEETAAADEKDVDSSSKKEPATTEETQEGEAPTQEPDGEKSEQQAPSSSGPALPKLDAPTDNDEPRAENGYGEKSTASNSNDHPATDCTKKDDTADSKAVSPVPPSGRDHEVNGRKDVQDDKDAQHDRATDESKDDEKEEAKEAEPSSQAETELRRQVEKLQQELAHLQAEDREASIALADARISTMGPFLINPFHERGPALTQELQWLTTVIRKEKTKMGSTGNKKKIVSATDLLERNDTFINGDIEALVEGLPGSEFCPSYVFQAFRAGGASAVSQAWVHEAKLRQEREREKQAMSASKAKADASQLREKERKRKRREDERDARKRQKEGEMDEKKRARAEERMARLNVQVDERLFKEACFQREKVVLLLAKSLGKDFSMRRKAAELVSGQSILDGLTKKNVVGDSGTLEIPSLGRVYDEDVLRVWDFFTTFGSTFLERGYLPNIPTLDSLQDAIDCLRDEKEYRKTRPEAIDQLVQIAMALCHPLAATLTRYLFASLIALNPALQKDFGAAFFNEVNATATAKDGSENAASKSVLPMNEMTWQEVARLTFLSDSMGEIGYSRQDSAHLLRGYRSGGHPNSKESKRLRRCEDNSVALLRQELSQRESNKALESLEESSTDYKIRVYVPARPSASRDEWIFYLHNLKSLPQDAVKPMKENIRKAIALLEAADPKPADAKAFLSDLHRGLTIIEGVKATEEELSHTDTQSCKKARRIFLRVLDRASGEVFSSNVIGSVVHKDDDEMSCASESKAMGSSIATVSSDRQRMGLLNSLTLSDKEFKKYTQSREEYMAEALRLKEEMNGAEEGEEEDDDDDDDEDDADGDKKMPAVETEKPMEDGKTGASAVENGDGSVNNASPAALGSTEKNAKSEGEKPASAEIVATVVENGDTKAENDAKAVPERPDNASPFDEFCGDIPGAPELIRRCLAVLRTLCRTESAEPFLYPVDPQSNPGYYEVILKPMCFREVGMRLRDAASLYVRQSPGVDAVANDDMQREVVASIVAQFARNVRLIAQNSACYGNAGAMVVCAGEEMIRIFERLFLDWVLAPEDHRRPLELLDDDKCVDFHPSDDDDGTVLLCDSCEGKFNMSRLDPPLLKIPKGDWYCPRCVSGRSWGSLDPRIGKSVKAKRSVRTGDSADSEHSCGVIRTCVLGRPEGHNVKATLLYEVGFADHVIETWTLSEVDKALTESGQVVEPVACVEATAESPGYGFGTDRGVFNDLVPVPLNPRVSYTAGEAAVSSTVYRDTIAGSSALRLISPEEMTANEWLRLLVLLITKCSASELMQSLVGKMENESAEQMAKLLKETGKEKEIQEILPSISEDESEVATEIRSESSAAAAKEGCENLTSLLNGGGGAVKSVKAESVDAADCAAMVIDASAVEVVADVDMEEPVVVAEMAVSGNTDELSSNEEAEKAKRAAAFADKDNRAKAREDSIAAYCIKNEVRPTVASFEEDVVSQVVDSTLATKEQGLTFQSCRCRGMVCDFCGLSDVALGSPLLRAPSSEEWNELMPHAARSRRTSLLAELRGKKLAAVTIRVDGDIVSEKTDKHIFDGICDGGMTELLPRNAKGFQDELKFREESGLPFITGSLSAHECCAVAVHKARKECVMKEHAEREAYLVEWSCGMTCGRTLSLGKDAKGRSYWKFKADSSLFVCANERVMNGSMLPRKLWHKFTSAEEIASLLYFLGDDSIVPELKRAFPVAARMLKTRKWTELLLRRRFTLTSKPMVAAASSESSSVEPVPKECPAEPDADEDEPPYEENEDVLVESSDGKLLWNAKIVGVSRSEASDKVNGYRVHYDDWSSRFDEWVVPFRVVERVENNMEMQAEMFEDAASLRDGIPPELENMVARKFLHAKDRARGSAPVPNFTEVARVEPTATSSKKTLGMLKAALLLLEASLPYGAVDTSDRGAWRPSLAAEWRAVVRSTRGPSSLMRCLVLLESSLSLEWMDTHYIHLLSSLPIGWKAINEATVGLIALRIFVLDQGLQYDEVDK